jgi:hypothetical protein
MELQYYFQYILSWIYHNVLTTDASFAILRIILFIGLVSLLVYREFVLFTLLCIVIIAAEGFRMIQQKDGGSGLIELQNNHLWSWAQGAMPRAAGVDITSGVPIKEGFSLGWLPKIVQGDDSGKDHRRSNKFIEEDSNDFTEKYFKSKQCSIGSGAGSISMFGSNEIIGSRTVKLSGIYDFAGNVTDNKDDPATNVKRLKYFMDCVYHPVYRSTRGMEDFRETKKKMYSDINNHIIHINRCLKRFDTSVLFDTISDITADKSKPISLSHLDSSDSPYEIPVDNKLTVTYVSLITGDTNAEKMRNIQPLNKGQNGDNSSDQTYRDLISRMNTDERYKNKDALKQKYLNIYSKVYGYRSRIDEILSMMRTQTKNDSSLLYTIRVDERIIQELRMILAYLATIQRTNDIIVFEMLVATSVINAISIYGHLGPSITDLRPFDTENPAQKAERDKITGEYSIFKIPMDDDTYNTNDEKRYLYGITYYFNGGP